MLLRSQLSGFSQTVFLFKVYQVLERYGEMGLAQAAVYDVQPLKLELKIYTHIYVYIIYKLFIYWGNEFAYHFKEKSQITIGNLVLNPMSDFQYVFCTGMLLSKARSPRR